MRSPLLMLLLPALALGVASLIWYQQATDDTSATLLTESASCNLHQQACHIAQAGLQIELDITPKPIPIAKALAVSVHIEGVTPKRVQLDINGSNMYMGYNRIDLELQPSGEWTGKALLAFCTIDQMQWQLTVMIDTEAGEQIQAPFPLTTPH